MLTKQSSEAKLVRYEIGSGKLLLVALAGLALRSPVSVFSNSVHVMCPVRELIYFPIFQIGKLWPSGFYSIIKVKYRSTQDQNHNTNTSCSFSLSQSWRK